MLIFLNHLSLFFEIGSHGTWSSWIQLDRLASNHPGPLVSISQNGGYRCAVLCLLFKKIYFYFKHM